MHGLLGEDQRARLLAIANRCPVHLTLSSRIVARYGWIGSADLPARTVSPPLLWNARCCSALESVAQCQPPIRSVPTLPLELDSVTTEKMPSRPQTP
jgi:hypothetical protein